MYQYINIVIIVYTAEPRAEGGAVVLVMAWRFSASMDQKPIIIDKMQEIIDSLRSTGRL